MKNVFLRVAPIVFLFLLIVSLLSAVFGQTESLERGIERDVAVRPAVKPTPTPTPESRKKFRRFEVGVQSTLMIQSDFDIARVVFSRAGLSENDYSSSRWDTGIGARFTYNITRRFSLEAEVNYMPSSPTLQDLIDGGATTITQNSSGGEKTQVLAGVKYGLRRKHFGVFAKARPGLIHFTAFSSVDAKWIAHGPNGETLDILLALTEKPATFFNIDVGGVFEYYPTKRTIIRFDLGDTIIRYGSQKPKDINPSFVRHNLQGSIGIGFRF